MKVKVLMLVMFIMSLVIPTTTTATTTDTQTALSCVEVGWVVEDGAKFGIRNRCDQRIYVKIFDQQTQVNSEFLDRSQWFPIQQGRKIELFANESNYQAGSVDRTVELTQDIYCQTLPEGKQVSECEGYVAPPVVAPVEPTPETPPVVSPQPEEPVETPTPESTQPSGNLSQLSTNLLAQPYAVAGLIFIAVIIVGGLLVMLVPKIGNRKPKSIYVRSNRRRYRNR